MRLYTSHYIKTVQSFYQASWIKADEKHTNRAERILNCSPFKEDLKRVIYNAINKHYMDRLFYFNNNNKEFQMRHYGLQQFRPSCAIEAKPVYVRLTYALKERIITR